VNAVIKPITYPLPLLQDLFHNISENQSGFVSALDLCSAYSKVKLDENLQNITTFVTHEGSFKHKYLPFGLQSSVSVFQQLMTEVFRGLTFKYVIAYVDDVLVHSRTFEEHLVHLDTVFQRLRGPKLKLHPAKCVFAVSKLLDIGHYLSADGIEIEPMKLDPVKSFPIPKIPTKVKSFLGLVSYYRKFIISHSQICVPLYELLKKQRPFFWSEKYQIAFDKLKTRTQQRRF